MNLDRVETRHLGASLHFRLDEPKKMLLVHAARMMHMGVNLSHIIEVSVGAVSVHHQESRVETPTGGARAVQREY